MARAPRKQGESDVYHVVARGVSRSIIFEDDADRSRFLEALASLSREHDAAVYVALDLFIVSLKNEQVIAR